MTKLIVSCGTLQSGGAERVLSILSEPFASNFGEIIYLTWLDAEDFYTLDSRVKRVCIERECHSKVTYKMALWFRNYIKKEQPTLVLSFLEPFNVLVCSALIGMKTPVVVANRNDPRYVWGDLFHRTWRKLAYRKAVGNLCQTENNMNYFTGSLYRKSYVIYNPIFLPESYRGKALQSVKRNRIVTVARLDKQKNLTMLIDAFELFHHNFTDYELTIYGSGPLKEEIEDYIKGKHMEPFIFTPGAQSGVWDKIIDAKCFAMSSWYEGMPNALLEAMCLGLPCVSTKVSGAVDLIENNVNGFLVDLDDRKAMADAFRCIASDQDASMAMAENATKLYDLLQKDKICNEWVTYLKGIIEKVEQK